MKIAKIIGVWTFLLASAPVLTDRSAAEVASVAAQGFEVRELVHVAAAPSAVYAALITPSRWWDSKHTFSGDASRLTLEAKAGGCWCETLADGGSVQHMTVVYAAPAKALRFRGGLGPLQAIGVEGSLTVTLTAAAGGTDMKFAYSVGGYSKDGFDDLSKGVDGVLGLQAARLKKLIETGNPESPAP